MPAHCRSGWPTTASCSTAACARPTPPSPSGRSSASTPCASRSWSRVAPSPRAYTPPEGFDPANPDAGYNWGDIDRAVEPARRRGHPAAAHARRPAAAVGLGRPRVGNPRYQPSAWHFGAVRRRGGQRATATASTSTSSGTSRTCRCGCSRRRLQGKRCTPVSPHTYRYMVRAAYPAIHAVDPESRVLVGALAPAGREPDAAEREHAPAAVPARVRVRRRAAAAGRAPAPCRSFQPAHRRRHRLPPAQHEAPAARGLSATPTTRRWPACARFERVLDAAPAARAADGLDDAARPLARRVRATRPTRPTSCAASRPAARTATSSRPRTWRGATRACSSIAQYLWRTRRSAAASATPAGSRACSTFDGEPKPALAHFDDPFWIDFARSVIWGQIRPGRRATTSSVQVRAAGRRHRVADARPRARPRADGTWFVRTQLEPFAAYRAVCGDGRTTDAIVAAPAVGRRRPAVRRTEVSDGLPVERRVAAPTPGARGPAVVRGPVDRVPVGARLHRLGRRAQPGLRRG